MKRSCKFDDMFISIQQMEKTELDSLVKELNELSEYEQQNKKRMMEIAHVLVMHYKWKKA